MNVALLGYGNVGRALARLLAAQRPAFPFQLTAIHTATHGTAYGPGLVFGPPAPSVEAFLDRARPDVLVELTPLNPSSGEPAISHVRAAFARNIHVVTANKGPLAFAYHQLAEEAARRRLLFRFEAVTMDGTPVYNLVRHNLPGVQIKGFAGAFNSTSKVILGFMERGLTLDEGIAEARRLGVAEADPYFDIDGWDSACKAAALANVLMDARLTPETVDRKGIARLTPEKVLAARQSGKRIVLVARASRSNGAVKLRVRAEVLPQDDILCSVQGTSNLLLLETDLMGKLGVFTLSPGVEQTAYGCFSDLVDIARSL